jgi:hypothetical protein
VLEIVDILGIVRHERLTIDRRRSGNQLTDQGLIVGSTVIIASHDWVEVKSRGS